MGAIDERYDDPAEAVRGADLVILCAPVGRLASLLSEISPALVDGALVTDVGSTKRAVVEAAERSLPSFVHFVGSHPMAGSEKRGVQFARADLFDQAVCILTPTHRTAAMALAAVESFWRSLGMRTTQLNPVDHDRLLADVSHLPHAVAGALIAMQEDAAFDLCGKGFLDMTRIAGGDPGLWRDILVENRENVRGSLARFIANLHAFDRLLAAGTADEIEQWLRAAHVRREDMLGRRAASS
jgi:prephenate dehydrogenase